MRYKITVDKPARRFIEKQPREQQERLLRAIMELPLAGDIKPLKGHDSVFRLRVGDFRIIYSVNKDTLTVLIMNAGNRGDIYK